MCDIVNYQYTEIENLYWFTFFEEVMPRGDSPCLFQVGIDTYVSGSSKMQTLLLIVEDEKIGVLVN